MITGTVSTWPLAWAPIVRDIRSVDSELDLPAEVRASLGRLRARAERELSGNDVVWSAHASLAEHPVRIRSYQDTPRETAHIGAGFSWNHDRFNVVLNGQWAESPADGKEFRADGSEISVLLGNFSLSANTLERWWGPGWDGNLILSNNARPIPALSLERNLTDAFDSKWLRWLGPWDLALHFGRFESDREVPDARFFGMRLNFRPLPSLEIGLSRTAQWCGEGRPCGLDTFVDLLLGKDNIGDEGIDVSNEPGNQLAGFDVRWATRIFDRPLAFYAQLIGEDEAGGFPSRYLGQFGVETSGMLGDRWSYRWFGEFAGTSCEFHQSSEIFNCAYNHGVYRTGYRYRGRAVGHGSDNDTRIVSSGLILADDSNTQWFLLARYGALNRGGDPDPGNSLTATRIDVASLDLTHARDFKYGRMEVGLGLEHSDDDSGGSSDTDGRAFLRWRSFY